MQFLREHKNIFTTREEVPQEELLIHPAVVCRKFKLGFGIFAVAKINKDEIIEEARYIVYESAHCTSPVINNYAFGVADDNDQNQEPRVNKICERNALVLGYGSLYNHSNENNADYYLNESKDVYTYYANRDVESGEQITINYGEVWWSSRELMPELL